VRIVSLNAWGGAMYRALVDWLPRSGADVLCLQEVTRTPGLEGWATFDDGERQLPQRAHLIKDVNRAMPHHRGYFAASDTGPVEGAGTTYRQDFGVAMFIDRHISEIALRTEFVHGSFAVHTVWPSTDRPRNAQAVRLYDRAAARALTVVNVHGLRDVRGKADTPSRREQARKLVRLVERTRKVNDLVVLAGDLNLLPSSETFAILDGIGLVDLVGTSSTRTSQYTGYVRHASYLLVSDVSAVKHFEVQTQPEVSDHRALVLDI
jgi:endonuclease/exonuclease/phosphatase family metal-dependent hydrolase